MRRTSDQPIIAMMRITKSLDRNSSILELLAEMIFVDSFLSR